ncbi:hypothetical protein [Caenimonas soli]|uniref:hypothetical protein n=1 Tax=Caenimonas soli TaxID=2735555 RepID=UPI0015543A2D|nr:hypothetical protein [Caenimonas soli]NPC57069.1 hypothetical protein [Caenimonas soli]
MNRFLVPTALIAACGLAFAKLPPPDDAAKAKAAETAAKAAWQAKVDAFLLCKAQDKVAALYTKNGGKTVASKDAKPVATAAAPAAAQPAAAAASGTPVVTAAAPLPPCAEPGPFAYNPPEQKPLETAGAHSPSGTAASPPSVKPNSAEMAPAKK